MAIPSARDEWSPSHSMGIASSQTSLLAMTAVFAVPLGPRNVSSLQANYITRAEDDRPGERLKIVSTAASTACSRISGTQGWAGISSSV